MASSSGWLLGNIFSLEDNVLTTFATRTRIPINCGLWLVVLYACLRGFLWLFLFLFFFTHAFKCFIPLLLVFLFLASETCNDFHPMFFTHDRSFEEFFCICIQLLNKTWKEMRATSEDFNKARKGVGRESLGRMVKQDHSSLEVQRFTDPPSAEYCGVSSVQILYTLEGQHLESRSWNARY